jgi:hypothetical protein
MFNVGDKVIAKNYSLHKDDCLTVCKVLTEEDLIDIIDVDNHVFTGKKYYYLKEVLNLFDEEDLTLYEDKQE